MGSVVCDRYIASTLAYHIAMDARRVIHDDTGLLKPHFAFLLRFHLVGGGSVEVKLGDKFGS